MIPLSLLRCVANGSLKAECCSKGQWVVLGALPGAVSSLHLGEGFQGLRSSLGLSEPHSAPRKPTWWFSDLNKATRPWMAMWVWQWAQGENARNCLQSQTAWTGTAWPPCVPLSRTLALSAIPGAPRCRVS